MFGVTPQGFIRKKFNDILEEMKTDARSRFGQEIDLSDFSPLLPMLELMSYSLAQQWENLENVYYSNFLTTASGVNLDRVVSVGAIKRKDALAATTQIEFKGEPDIVIPVETIVSTANNIILYKTKETVRTDKFGVGIVDVICLKSGKIGNVSENQIVKIKNPIIGISKVTNKHAVTNGRERESDAELIARYRSTGFAKGGTVAGITAAIERVKGVVSVAVHENMENKTDANGIPYRAIWALVEGGDKEKVARAIISTKPAGVATHGDITVHLLDSIGNKHHVKFSRPEHIKVELVYTITQNLKYKSSIEEEIQDLAYKHALTLRAGDDINLWRFIAILPDYNGVDHLEIKAKKQTEAEYTTEILHFLPREIASVPIQNIRVIKK